MANIQDLRNKIIDNNINAYEIVEACKEFGGKTSVPTVWRFIRGEGNPKKETTEIIKKAIDIIEKEDGRPLLSLQSLNRELQELKKRIDDIHVNVDDKPVKLKSKTVKSVKATDKPIKYGKFVLGFLNDSFKDVFFMWLDYKKERRESYKTQKSIEFCYKQLVEFSGDNPKIALEIVKRSMANNWAGLFAIDNNDKPKHAAAKISKTISDADRKRF